MHHLKTKIRRKSSKYSFASSSANDIIVGTGHGRRVRAAVGEPASVRVDWEFVGFPSAPSQAHGVADVHPQPLREALAASVPQPPLEPSQRQIPRIKTNRFTGVCCLYLSVKRPGNLWTTIHHLQCHPVYLTIVQLGLDPQQDGPMGSRPNRELPWPGRRLCTLVRTSPTSGTLQTYQESRCQSETGPEKDPDRADIRQRPLGVRDHQPGPV